MVAAEYLVLAQAQEEARPPARARRPSGRPGGLMPLPLVERSRADRADEPRGTLQTVGGRCGRPRACSARDASRRPGTAGRSRRRESRCPRALRPSRPSKPGTDRATITGIIRLTSARTVSGAARCRTTARRCATMATSALCLSSQLRRPLPDVVVVRTTVFGWAIDREAGDRRQDLVPGLGVPTHDGRRTHGVQLREQLPDQVLRHAAWGVSPIVPRSRRVSVSSTRMWNSTKPPIAVLLASVVPLEQEQLVPLQRGLEAGPTSATLWMGQAHLDGVPDRRQIVRFGRSYPIR